MPLNVSTLCQRTGKRKNLIAAFVGALVFLPVESNAIDINVPSTFPDQNLSVKFQSENIPEGATNYVKFEEYSRLNDSKTSPIWAVYFQDPGWSLSSVLATPKFTEATNLIVSAGQGVQTERFSIFGAFYNGDDKATFSTTDKTQRQNLNKFFSNRSVQLILREKEGGVAYLL